MLRQVFQVYYLLPPAAKLLQDPGFSRAGHTADDRERPGPFKLFQRPPPVSLIPAFDKVYLEAIKVQRPGHGAAARPTPPAMGHDLFFRRLPQGGADKIRPFGTCQIE